METRIEVDYNERDERGLVVAGVPAEQAADLRVGSPVTLYDPVDRLRVSATVAWVDAGARAAGFAPDWAGFEDDDRPEAEPTA
jgi:hypothetical protein